MADRASLFTGACYCGLFALPFQAAFATFLMRGDPTPRLAVVPLFLLGALLFLAARLLLERGVAVPVLAVTAVLLTGAGLAAVLRLSFLPGPASAAFAVFLALAAAVLSLYTAFQPVTVPRLLVQSDVLVLCALWACLLETAGSLTAGDLLFFLAGVLGNLACLLALRTFGGNREVVYGSLIRGGLLSLGLLAVIAGALVLFVRLFAGASRTALGVLLDGAAALGRGVWGAFDRFFHWLASLFPAPDVGPVQPPEQIGETGGAGTDLTQVQVDPGLLWALGIALAAAVLLLAVVLLVRARRVRLRRAAAPRRDSRAAAVRAEGALRRRLDELLFRLRFRLAFALRRSSPTGLLVWLERWGARHHAPRGRGETYRAYLGRLSALPGPAEDGALPPALKALADCLDGQYFAGRRTPLPAGAAAAIRRGFSRRPAGEPEKT